MNNFLKIILSGFFLIFLAHPSLAGETLTKGETEVDIETFFSLIFENQAGAFRYASPEDWQTAKTRLLGTPNVEDPATLLTGLSETLDLLKDGHVWVYPGERFREITRAFPIRFHPFPDGLYITGGEAAYADLVGAKVINFGGVPAGEVLKRFYQISYHDNEPGKLQLVEEYLRMPAIHKVLGTSQNSEDILITVETPEGDIKEVRLGEAGSLSSDLEIGPFRRPTPEGWVDLYQKSGLTPPLWQSRLEEFYWFEEIPQLKALYLNVGRTFEDPENPIPAFARAFGKALGKKRVQKVIIDLRVNRGGNHALVLPLFHEIIRQRKFEKPNSIFVLTSSYTNSAAVTFAAMLEQHTNAVFIGEPTAAPPNYNAEVNAFVLPNSKFEVELSAYHWVNSDPRDERLWMHPDYQAPLTFEAFSNGRDPGIEKIRDILDCQGCDWVKIRNDPITFFNWARDSQTPALPENQPQ